LITVKSKLKLKTESHQATSIMTKAEAQMRGLYLLRRVQSVRCTVCCGL